MRLDVQLRPGDQIEFYSSAVADRPYFTGIVDRILHTRRALTVKFRSESPSPEVVAEVEPEEPSGNVARPRGWQ